MITDSEIKARFIVALEETAYKYLHPKGQVFKYIGTCNICSTAKYIQSCKYDLIGRLCANCIYYGHIYSISRPCGESKYMSAIPDANMSINTPTIPMRKRAYLLYQVANEIRNSKGYSWDYTRGKITQMLAS
jgi:hypothetical protein